jgi:hypothetical protein
MKRSGQDAQRRPKKKADGAPLVGPKQQTSDGTPLTPAEVALERGTSILEEAHNFDSRGDHSRAFDAYQTALGVILPILHGTHAHVASRDCWAGPFTDFALAVFIRPAVVASTRREGNRRAVLDSCRRAEGAAVSWLIAPCRPSKQGYEDGPRWECRCCWHW